MTVHPAVLDTLEALAAEVQALHMAQTVQKSAYVALVSHLAKLGLVQLPVLAADLEMLASVQPDEGWQSGHAQLADVLKQLHAGCHLTAGGQ